MSIVDLAPEIALLLGAIVVLLTAAFIPQRWHWVCAVMALLALAASAALCARQLGNPAILSFAGSWAIDDVSIRGRLLILAASGFAVAMSPDWFRSDRRHGEFYCLLLLSTVGVMLMAGAADIMQLVVAMLLSSITGYTLAAYHRDWALSLEAGVKYFLVGAFANAVLLVGVVLLYGLVGHTTYVKIAAVAASGPPTFLLNLALALIVVGIGFKLGAAPAHSWVADVAQGAPAPAAAYLTVVPKIGGAIALARLVELFSPATLAWPSLIAAIAVTTMTVGNLAALWQRDLRRLLGWSSVAQAGYLMMAIAVLGSTPQALPALLFFIATYAVSHLLAFAVVTQLRGRTALDDYRGLGSKQPLLAALLVISLLSLVGIPPLAGFAGKLALFIAAVDGSLSWLAVVAIINTVVSLFYYLRVISRLYFDPPADAAEVHLLGGWAGAAAWLAAALTLLLGLAAEPVMLALQGSTLIH